MNNFVLLNQDSSNLVSSNNWSSTPNMLGQLFLVVLAFVIVLLLAYYVTKFFARSGGIRKGKNIETIEAMFINQTSSVRLIRVGGKFFLIGVAKDKISLLTEIDGNNIDTDYASSGFQSQPLTTLLKRFSKNGIGKEPGNADDDDE